MSTFTIEFGPESNRVLERLSEESGRAKVDVVRRALDVYNALSRETKGHGKQIIIEDPKTGDRETLIV